MPDDTTTDTTPAPAMEPRAKLPTLGMPPELKPTWTLTVDPMSYPSAGRYIRPTHKLDAAKLAVRDAASAAGLACVELGMYEQTFQRVHLELFSGVPHDASVHSATVHVVVWSDDPGFTGLPRPNTKAKKIAIVRGSDVAVFDRKALFGLDTRSWTWEDVLESGDKCWHDLGSAD